VVETHDTKPITDPIISYGKDATDFRDAAIVSKLGEVLEVARRHLKFLPRMSPWAVMLGQGTREICLQPCYHLVEEELNLVFPPQTQ
jgi:hypothetical protein